MPVPSSINTPWLGFPPAMALYAASACWRQLNSDNSLARLIAKSIVGGAMLLSIGLLSWAVSYLVKLDLLI